jgi:serine/threonine-protein kinase
MSDEPMPGRRELPLDVLDHIDRICDRFQAAWEQGTRSRVEDYLNEIDAPYRPALLLDLLAAELDARRRRGERPEPGEYHERFPDDSAAVEAAFATAPIRPAVPSLGGMIRPDTGRDLLFGLIALQNGLINQEQLLGAFRAWAREKARPLGEHLVACGDLDAEQRGAVEALVRLHLKKYGGDPEKSLASISAGRSTREGLAGIGDPEIEATLGHVGTGSRTTELGGGDFDRTASYVVGSASADGQRFRVLRPHASGGLGAVFVALDCELHREVALKQILERHADDAVSRSRFLVEAEITGGLEHPGIVPVYGLGTYADGRPYYAMRFIRGDSLKEAIGRFHADLALKRDPGRQALELRKVLRRFLDVCNAIDYAHSRGVLHRDIKPGNVIVGKHGETLVVDWGLAKHLGPMENAPDLEERPLHPLSASGSAQTLPGSVLGTPGYMSPEQAQGDLERLGPRSDVYSLGATLYCLLVGRPPFDDLEVETVLRKVHRGEFPPPRRVRPEVPRALDAICLKAMALRAEDRYGSPRALAEEIERWMADEPVSAWPEPWRVRLGRWSRRHRTLVTGAAVLLVAVTVALAAGAALLTRANARTEQRRKEAEGNFELARDAVERYFTRVSEDRLLNEPQMERLRKDLLETAREFYQKFVDQRQGDPRSRADLGHAYLRLSLIASALGAAPEAVAHGEQARSIFTTLAVEHPEFTAYLHDLAQTHYRLGQCYQATDRWAQAEASCKKAFAIQERLVADHPEVTEYQYDLAWSHHTLGLLYEEAGRLTEAEAMHKKAFGIWERHVTDHPEGAQWRSGQAAGHDYLGRLYSVTGRLVEAEAAFRRELEVQEKLVADNPEVTKYRSDLALVHNNLGVLYKRASRPGEAEASGKKALEIWERLAIDHPEVTDYRRRIAFGHMNLGSGYHETGRLAEAEGSYKKALGIWERIITNYPEDAQCQSGQAVGQRILGRIYSVTGRLAEAEAAFRRALEVQEKLVADNPEVSKYRSDLALVHDNLGGIYQQTSRLGEAEASGKKALEIWERLATDHPEVTEYRRNLALSHNSLGTLYRSTGGPAEAEASYNKALAILERLVADHPEVILYRRDLATSHDNLGYLFQTSARPAAAEASYKKALGLKERLVADHPEVIDDRSELAWSHDALGRLYLESGRLAEAAAPSQRAVELREKLVADQPRVIHYRRDLASNLSSLGLVYQETGRLADAEGSHMKALEMLEKLAAECPQLPWCRQVLGNTQDDLGGLYMSTGRLVEAEAAYQRAREIREKLATEHPDDVDFSLLPGGSYNNLGALALKRGDPNRALEWLDRAETPIRSVLSRQPSSTEARKLLYKVHLCRARALARLRRFQEALVSWDRAVELAEPMRRTRIRTERAVFLVRSGDYRRAISEAEAIISSAPNRTGLTIYNVACVESLASALAHADAMLEPAARTSRAESLAARAVARLGQARAAGYFSDPANVAHIGRDPDLDPLRSRPDFRLLVQDLGFPADPFAH